jgi:hypothetical protein
LPFRRLLRLEGEGSELPGVDSAVYRTAAWLGVAALAVSLLVLAALGRWVGVLILVPFLVVSIVFIRFEPRLPHLFDALFAWAAVINAAGYAWNLYDVVPLYDEAVHFVTTFAVTLTFGFLTFDQVRHAFREHPLLFLVVITSFGLAVGVLWELFEWTFGFIGPIPDTMLDFVLDGSGALLAAALCVHARAYNLQRVASA